METLQVLQNRIPRTMQLPELFPVDEVTSVWGVYLELLARRRSEAKTPLMPASEHAAGAPADISETRRIIKGRPIEVGFECDAKLYREEHPYGP